MRWRILRVAVLAPALATAVTARAQEPADAPCDGASVAGRVTDETGTIPLPGATVIVRWGAAPRFPSRAPSARDGSYHICAPRDAIEAVVWAELGDYSSPAERRLLADEGSASLLLRIVLGARPEARIMGRVRDIHTNDGVAAAAIELVEGHTAAMSGSRGDFVMTGVPPGRYRLRVRHLGYAEISREIEAQSGRTLEIHIDLTRQPLTVAPLVVTALRSRKLEIHGFYERKRWGELLGLGMFIEQSDIERRQPLRVSHMIADAPGIRLRCAGSGIRSCRLENTRAGCDMNVYIDGVLLRGTGSLDEFILPLEVGAVEVYQGPAQLPAEFAGSDARCGAVVIWTR